MAKGAYIGVDGVARKIKKGYIGVKTFTPVSLPNGYTQVEYLESSGTQYIDTGIIANQNTSIEIKGKIIATDGFFFGGETGYNTNAWHLYTNGGYYDIGFGVGGAAVLSSLPAKVGDVFEYVTDKWSAKLTVNGTEYNHDFSESTSFTAPYTTYLFGLHRETSYYGTARIYFCRIYDDDVLVRDYVPCINSSNVAGMYDLVTNQFYTNAGTGAFIAGTSALSVARKIKKAYIGIGGVARPFWSGGEVAYYGTITAMSSARSELAATSIGDYALFGGGASGTTATAYNINIDAYNSSLTRNNSAALSVKKRQLAATSVGGYALFGGGGLLGTTTYTSVDAIDESLTLHSSNNYRMSIAREMLAATSVGGYALFGGGYNNATGVNGVVDAYNSSLTRTTATPMSDARRQLAATSVGGYALFGGGQNAGGTYYNNVDAYDTSLTKTTATNLSIGRYCLAATSVGGYALFGGGWPSGGYSDVVDAYSASLTRTWAPTLTAEKRELAATTVGDFAIFFGGRSSTLGSHHGDIYDSSLTRITLTNDLVSQRYLLAGTTVGNYALFAGGETPYSSTVNCYTVV